MEEDGTTITADSLQQKLAQSLESEFVDVVDMSGGCGASFNVTIVSPQFVKKTTLARHRLVNAALKEEVKIVHAWVYKCLTPEEWDRQTSKDNQATSQASDG